MQDAGVARGVAARHGQKRAGAELRRARARRRIGSDAARFRERFDRLAVRRDRQHVGRQSGEPTRDIVAQCLCAGVDEIGAACARRRGASSRGCAARVLALRLERRQRERRGAGAPRRGSPRRRVRRRRIEAHERDAERPRLVAQAFAHGFRRPRQRGEPGRGAERADRQARRARVRGTRARELVAACVRACEQRRKLLAVRQATERALRAARRDDEQMVRVDRASRASARASAVSTER